MGTAAKTLATLALGALVACPSAAYAQTAADEQQLPPLTVTAAPLAPWFQPPPPSWLPPPPPPPPPPASDSTYSPEHSRRLTLQLLGGFAGLAGGVLVGGLAGAGVVAALCTPAGSAGCEDAIEVGAMVGLGVGYVFGPALAVWSIGSAMGGNGQFGHTLAGSFIGGLLGMPFLGALGGYEISANAQRPPARRAMLAPSVRVNRQGALVGLVALF
jgi:hypothetical protein